ncbi:MAG TPA: hypothetical protein VH854_09930 [Thermoanaerobaculia bacterium]|jgi:hypothetical protein|nr:hypothetical protein [Thermoanaerobaculia bacterium]
MDGDAGFVLRGFRLGGCPADREQTHCDRYTEKGLLGHGAIIWTEFRTVKTKRPGASIIYVVPAYDESISPTGEIECDKTPGQRVTGDCGARRDARVDAIRETSREP